MTRLSGSLRIRILERDGYKCVYCGTPSSESPLEVDHVVPRAAGGRDISTNLVAACRRCNNGKRANLVKLPDGVSPQPVGKRHTSSTSGSKDVWPYVMARTKTEYGRDTGLFKLSIYAEIDYTAILGTADPYPADPFDWYCARLRDEYPDMWSCDAVPILWSVVADGPGLHTFECAPWHRHAGLSCGWERYFEHPVDHRGKPIDWRTVPIHMRRFEGFEQSIGWLPTIDDRTAPVKSLWIARRRDSETPKGLRLPCPECGNDVTFTRPQMKCDQCDIWLIGRVTQAGSTIVDPDRTWIMGEGGWTHVRLLERSA